MGQEVAKVKKILRQQIREAMAELTDQERAWSDGELIPRFLEHPKLAEAHTVLLYYGVGQEVATAGLIQTLLDQGATVVVIEHDLDVIRSADYLIDLGPGGGQAGGRIVAAGTPAQVAACPESVTGRYL